jgi:predicted nuclease of predicted toxin-antitoxin system
MKLLIDMNLPPDWVETLEQGGWEVVHWSTVGDPRATDHTIMEWARANGYTVFTHDLDFGAILAVTRAQKPSVIQVRTQDIMSQSLGSRMVQILGEYESVLEKGALVTIDKTKSRVHILPFS